MTPDLLRRVGVALYGDTWTAAMARTLNVGARNIRYWHAGERPIPAGVIAELAEACERQGRELVEVAKLLRAEAKALDKEAIARTMAEMEAVMRLREE